MKDEFKCLISDDSNEPKSATNKVTPFDVDSTLKLHYTSYGITPKSNLAALVNKRSMVKKERTRFLSFDLDTSDAPSIDVALPQLRNTQIDSSAKNTSIFLKNNNRREFVKKRIEFKDKLAKMSIKESCVRIPHKYSE